MYRGEEEIKQSMLKNVKNTEDKSQNSLVHDALSPASIELANFYLKLEEVRKKLDVENLFGDELERFANQRTGMTRKTATRAITVVTIVGLVGSRLKVGDLVGSDTVNFVIKESKTIDEAGTIDVMVECEDYGVIGNVPVDAINKFPVAINGLFSVTNAATVVNGYDAETDTDFRERYYERIRRPATSGNKYHYLNWAKEVEGVGDARVIPLWKGDNTVKVIIIDSNKQTASEDLSDRVQEHIDPGIRGLGEGEAPIGAFCTVVSANEKLIDVSVTIAKDSNYSIEQIKTSIGDEIVAYLKTVAFRKNLVSYAHIGALILDVEGVLDYTGLRVNLGIENIIVCDEEVAILGQVVADEPTP